MEVPDPLPADPLPATATAADELMHARRVIARMQEREKWFEDRIRQLELYCKSIKAPPPEDEQPLRLNLGDTSLPDHERMAKNMHTHLLQEEGLCEGMTPIAPLLPIPTHSIKKAVSWHELNEKNEDGK
jgi:hypothetical protein